MTTIDLDALISRAHSADADGRFVAVEPKTMLALIALARRARTGKSDAEIRDKIANYQLDYENAAFGGIEYTCSVIFARIQALEWVLQARTEGDK